MDDVEDANANESLCSYILSSFYCHRQTEQLHFTETLYYCERQIYFLHVLA